MRRLQEGGRLQELRPTLGTRPAAHSAGGQQAVRGLERHELAAILKDVGNFSMDIFSGRLALQKTVRILQAFGVDLGCRFARYLHGPHCKSLFGDGREARTVIDMLPKREAYFEGGETQRCYGQSRGFMADKKRGPALPEICASICRLAAAGIDKNCALKAVECEKPELARAQRVSTWDELDTRGGRQ